MTIREKIMADRIAFMKAKDTERLQVIRTVISEIEGAEKKGKTPVVFDDAAMVTFLRKQVATREKTAEEYMKGGAVDKADRERMEIDVISTYLPVAPSDEEIADMIKTAIAEMGIDAPTMRDTGSIVKHIGNPAVGGKEVSGYLKSL